MDPKEQAAVELGSSSSSNKSEKIKKKKNKSSSSSSNITEESNDLVGDWEGDLPNLDEFDTSIIEPDFTISLFGMRRTGKSFFMRFILSMMIKYFTRVIVLSNTSMNGYWQQYIPVESVFTGWRPAVVQAILEIQRQKVLFYRDKIESGEYNASICIILDDIISDPELWKDPVLNKLFQEGRHYKICVMLASQYAKGIAPCVRGNTDLAVIFATTQKLQIKSLTEDYFGRMPLRQGEALLVKNTRDNKAIVILNKKRTGITNKDIFWCLAKDPGSFIIGTELAWKDDPRYEKLKRGEKLTQQDAYDALRVQEIERVEKEKAKRRKQISGIFA